MAAATAAVVVVSFFCFGGSGGKGLRVTGYGLGEEEGEEEEKQEGRLGRGDFVIRRVGFRLEKKGRYHAKVFYRGKELENNPLESEILFQI